MSARATGASSAPIWRSAASGFVVVWESDYQDGGGLGVFGQRYDFGGATIKVESPNTDTRWQSVCYRGSLLPDWFTKHPPAGPDGKKAANIVETRRFFDEAYEGCSF